MKLYVLERNALPDALADLVKAGFLDELPRDPWGREIQLQVRDAAKREFRLLSLGPDGEAQTPDDLVLTR